MGILDKIKGFAKQEVDEFQESRRRSSQIKKIERDTLFEERKKQAVIVAKKKAEIESKRKVKTFASIPKNLSQNVSSIKSFDSPFTSTGVGKLLNQPKKKSKRIDNILDFKI